MSDYHVAFGVASVALASIGPILYVRSMFKDGTKPHPFTWLLFFVIDGTVCLAQFLNGGGPGAWLLAMTSVQGGIIFLLSLKRGEKRIARIDWVCLGMAFVGIAAWSITNNAVYAVLFASVTELIAKTPTVRKSYLRPYEESITIWAAGVVSFSLSVIALTSLTLTTLLFPIIVILTNIGIVGMILLRRRKLGRVAA